MDKMNLQIDQISELKEALILHLIEESIAQGFRFVERLMQEYQNGTNCFDKSGEVLLIASSQNRAIAIGGLNQDPYFNDPKIGRLRHVYVQSTWRRRGVGRLIVEQLIDEARLYYQQLTLRTDTREADQFYQSLGFRTQPSWEHTTHYLLLAPKVAVELESE
jgi:GNAT superfamily N-acetyltransferase